MALWQTFYLIVSIHKLHGKWSVVNTVPGTVFVTIHFLCNLPIGPISYTVTLQQAREPHSFIELMHKLRWKWSVVNTVPNPFERFPATVQFEHHITSTTYYPVFHRTVSRKIILIAKLQVIIDEDRLVGGFKTSWSLKMRNKTLVNTQYHPARQQLY
jgi:hypothetical protein